MYGYEYPIEQDEHKAQKGLLERLRAAGIHNGSRAGSICLAIRVISRQSVLSATFRRDLANREISPFPVPARNGQRGGASIMQPHLERHVARRDYSTHLQQIDVIPLFWRSEGMKPHADIEAFAVFPCICLSARQPISAFYRRVRSSARPRRGWMLLSGSE